MRNISPAGSELLRRTGAVVLLASAVLAVRAPGQLTATTGSFIELSKLPPALSTLAQIMGSRMTSAANASVTLTGTTTDTSGSRAATIVIQAPGLLAYRESAGRAIVFNGSSFQTGSGTPAAADQPIMESLLAHLPDAVILQASKGAGIRMIGTHFRTDDGKTPNYTGPYWTLMAFAPAPQDGLAWGQPLQQELFLAVNEKSGLPDEVRRVVNTGTAAQVTETQFLKWSNQGGQWFPGSIVRLEGGKQTLSFQVQSAATGAAVAATTFQP